MIRPDLPTSDSQDDQAPSATANPGQGTGGEPNGAQQVPPSDDVASLQKEREELRNQLLRTRAEFANYQKRARQQADADRVYAIGDLARDLLDALDNLERATGALRASASESITSGLEMVHKQMLAALATYGVEPIAALGEPFDPNLHEALLQQPSAEHPEGTVVNELGKGYRIHERVLRPSKVAVSSRPAR